MAARAIQFEQQAIKRIQKRLSRFDFSKSENKRALVRIGQLLEAQAKLNANRQGVKDEGNLINNIKYQIEANENEAKVQYGVYGVVYAALHEFGGPFTDQMRKAMFAKFRRMGKARQPGKGLIQGGRIRARPYLRPALAQNRARIIDILRGNV